MVEACYVLFLDDKEKADILNNCSTLIFFVFNPHLRICFINFRERGRERVREREREKQTSMCDKNIDPLPVITP